MPNTLNPLLQTHFDTALEHPNGIKKLRELILTLAMQGKLVEQNPNDQPASELLKEIQEEKARLVAEGKIKKSEALPAVKEEEKPFTIPNGWVWIRLGDVLEMINGRAFKPTDWTANGIPIVRIQNLNNLSAGFNYCKEELVDERHIISDDTILISWSGTPGTSFGAFIWKRGKAALNQHIFKCRQYCEIFRDKYLINTINSRLDHLISMAQGAVGLKHITKGTLEFLVLGLPPLAEQKRIVEKIDELFLLCDELEILKKSKDSKRKDLHQSVITQMLEADSQESFQKHFQFLTTHFHELYSVKENVKELRKAVLQLAVMGKLVPQDPKDQQASELLKEIQAEKARLVAEGKVKKSEALPAVKEEEKPFVIPKGWEWVRLGELMTSGLKNGYSPKETKSSVNTMKVLTLSSTTKATFDPSFFKYADYQNLDNEFFVKDGDFLIQRGNSIDYVGIVALVENCKEDVLYPDLIMKFRLFEKLNLRMFHKFMVSLYARNYFQSQASGTSGTMPKINQPVVSKFPLPLPPLAEQKRIVEKVDQLLALCDELEERIGKAEEKRGEILEGMVRG
ncbi:restriction endonuclease subunit S [Leptospira bourretii]|uniref:Restriction endonuclease subunit S n=3 Tax=Leptospira bourretii TaxID=2484962 RepID=A0A4R9IJM1_9LEPT|nr:restriction endonuclease subunit S [Leptospira bourretii]TGK87956.1 restriction endonuclease subunit S [Leptospira bourretii]TGK88608.1 restriction endonuclease subunit S [Leptospira bourretii]